MKDLLAPPSLDVLRTFARSEPLVALDFDGTLAPIVADRDRATMAPSTRSLLVRVASRFETVVISGRSRDDVRARLLGVAVRAVVGNHGAELDDGAAEAPGSIAAARDALAHSLRDLPGVEVEDKRHTLSVHYRGASDPAHAVRVIRQATAALPAELRVTPGHGVFNVAPAVVRHKGHALREWWRRTGRPTAIFVGDDTTDEDAFALGRSDDRLLGVRIGEEPTSAARYFLRTQDEIDRFLGLLVDLAG